MMLLAQDGSGAGQKIANCITDETLDGFIVSAKFHAESAVKTFIEENTQAKEPFVLFDNEFYVGNFQGSNSTGKLGTHKYFLPNLSRADLSPRNLITHVERVLESQVEYGLSRFVSPSIEIEALRSASEVHAFNFFETAIEICETPTEDLYLNLIISHSVLGSPSAIEELLGELTKFEVKGFYLIVDRKPVLWNADELAGQLILISTLTLNGYEVHHGYTDSSGILSLGVGATSIATGWHKNQRKFDQGRYISSVARTGKKLYFSTKLMNFIIVQGDLDQITERDLQAHVLSGISGEDNLIANIEDPAWNQVTQVTHYWRCLKRIIEEMKSSDDSNRLVSELINNALMEYKFLISNGITFGTDTGIAQIERYSSALKTFNDWFEQN